MWKTAPFRRYLVNLARFHQTIRREAVFFYGLEAALQKTIKLNRQKKRLPSKYQVALISVLAISRNWVILFYSMELSLFAMHQRIFKNARANINRTDLFFPNLPNIPYLRCFVTSSDKILWVNVNIALFDLQRLALAVIKA